jgi:hypothetical protein
MTYWYTTADQTAVTDGKGRVIPCSPESPDWAEVLASGEAILPPPPPVTMPNSITRWQCAVQLRTLGLISEAETLGMIGTAAPPAYVEALFAALSPADGQRAREAFGADEYERHNPLIAMLLPPGTTSGQADDFFRAAGQLKP